MASASILPRLMTADEFLQWDQYEPDRHELIDGVPVAMVGTTRRHDRITINLILGLGNRLRGTLCAPMTQDIATRVPGGNVRRPDVTVQCAPMDDSDLATHEPRVVFEVLSPSNAAFDQLRKLDEYRSISGIAAIVLVDSESAQIIVWSRSEGEWGSETSIGMDADISLPAIGVRLPLAEIYEDVTFPPRPRIVFL